MSDTRRGADEWERIAEWVNHVERDARDELVLFEGDRVEVVFLGEPWAYEAGWSDEHSRWVPIGGVPQATTSALRIRINVYLPAMDRVKWWEMDAETFQTLYECRKVYGLDRWLFEIVARSVSADGASGVYSILPEANLNKVELPRLADRPLFWWGKQDETDMPGE